MEGLRTIPQLIRRNDLITKVDVSDFYMHSLIPQVHAVHVGEQKVPVHRHAL